VIPVPNASTVNVAVWPATTETLEGWDVIAIDADEPTVSSADALAVVVPEVMRTV
jgi:hypothetical protein